MSSPLLQGEIKNYNQGEAALKRLSKTTLAIISAAAVELEATVERAQEYFDGRSEKWQDGDAGVSYQAWIDQLQAALDGLMYLPPSPDDL